MKRTISLSHPAVHSACLATALLIAGLFPSKCLRAQDDPFSELKRVAAGSDTTKKILPQKIITTSDPLWKAQVKTAIPYRPVTPADYKLAGHSPNEIVTLQNGNKMTFSQLLAKVNALQREVNLRGYSLLDKEIFRSQTITPTATLDGKAASTPNLGLPLKTSSQREAYLNPQMKTNTTTLKPLGDYLPGEQKKIVSGVITDLSSPETKVATVSVSPVLMNQASAPLKTIDELSTKDYSFGDVSTFKAGIDVSLRRQAKIFASGSKRTEFTITGKGRIYGAVLGNSFNVVHGEGTAYVPSDSSKQMSLKILVNIAGFDLVNRTFSYPARKVLAGERHNNFEYAKSVSVPLIWGFSITGTVGVKGSVGFSYQAELDRAFVKAVFKPIADIAGFLEVGLSAPLDIASITVKADLVLLKGFADLGAWFGIYNTNVRQIVLGYGYNISFFLEFLTGEILLKWKVGCISFPVDYCLLEGQHSFFKWSGKQIKGTYADERQLINISTIPILHRADDVLIK